MTNPDALPNLDTTKPLSMSPKAIYLRQYRERKREARLTAQWNREVAKAMAVFCPEAFGVSVRIPHLGKVR